MVLAALLGLLLETRVAQAGFSHTPDVTDTVRYNRDDFGVRLHVPDGFKGLPVLLTPGPKDTIRTDSMVSVTTHVYRSRFRGDAEPRYAFWVDTAKYKKGASGLVFDQTGLHATAAPTWFDQPATRYPEVKPPGWPGEGAIFYAIDTDRFGDGSAQESGAQSFTKHQNYVQGLGVDAIWLNGIHRDSSDTVDDAHQSDWRVVAETPTPPKGVDGVAATTPPGTQGWRVAVTEDNAYPLLQAGGANGVLDRRWGRLIYSWVQDVNMAPSSMVNGLENLRADYPDSVADKLVLRLAGPGRQRPSAVFRSDRKRLLQVWLLLLSLPGVPVIDSGDEIGLFDSDAPMEWNAGHQDSLLSDAVKKLIVLRAQRPSLYRGEYQPIDLEDDDRIFGFTRIDRRETTIVLLNNSEDFHRVHIEVGPFGLAQLHDLYGGTAFTVSGTDIALSLGAHGFAIIGS